MGQFEIFKDKKKKWRFRFKSGNGKIILQSEGYDSKRNARKSINSLINKIKSSCYHLISEVKE